MDTASVLMGVGLLLLFIAPVGYLVYNQNAKNKKQAKKMAFLATNKGFTLSDSINLRKHSLGIDQAAKKFLLLRNWKNEALQIYDFSDLQAVTMAKVNEDEASVNAVDEVRIIYLKIKLKNGAEEKVTFYTSEEDAVTQKSDLLNEAVKWEKLIKAAIKH